MASHVVLQHTTHYRYDRTVRLGPQTLRLCPRPDTSPQVTDFRLEVSPGAHQLDFATDAYGNRVAWVRFAGPATEFRIDVSMTLELVDALTDALTDASLQAPAHATPVHSVAAPARNSTDAVLPAYREPVGPNPVMEAWLAQLLAQGAATSDLPAHLCAAVAQRLAYRVRQEPGVQMPDESLALGSGSCRDSAWLLMAMLRSAGWAARFVSGYLVQTAGLGGHPEGRSDHSPADTGLHAWCEVHQPGAGWIGLDATSGQTIGAGHVALACAPMPWQAAPVEGSVEPCHVDFNHSIQVHLVK